MSKKEGYRSRATYKLKQIDKRFQILRKGYKVIDLGAAPGGWLQYAAEVIGDEGFILGVDKKPIAPLPYANVKTVELDLGDEGSLEAIAREVDGRVDVLLSDLSPNISGAWDVDVARQVYLCFKAIEVADRVLRRGGWMVVKIFQGEGTDMVVKALKERFEKVKLFKPPSSRKGSSEIYAVCRGYRRVASSTASMNT